MGSGTGERSESASALLLLTDLTHDNIVVPFISAFNLAKNAASGSFDLAVVVSNFDATTTNLAISVRGTTTAQLVIINVVAIDRTAMQDQNLYFLETGVFEGTNNLQASIPAITGFAADSFFVGVANFSMVTDFTQGISPFTISSSGGYTAIKNNYLNFIKRSCSGGDINYYSGDKMCYSSCPGATFANVTYSYCQACDASCYACSGTATSCLPCDDNCVACQGLATNCTSCNSGNHLIKVGTQCACLAGYYYVSSPANCLGCGVMVGCTTCTSSIACTACSAPFILDGGQCKCAAGQYIDTATCSSCSVAIPGCTVCTDALTCTTCDANFNWQINGSSLCDCKPGTTLLPNNTCLLIGCDDGNTDAGDGCFEGLVEPHFTCLPTLPSKCSYNLPLTLSFVSLEKNLTSNSLVLTLKVSPKLKIFNGIDFSKAVALSNSLLWVDGYVYNEEMSTLAFSISYSATVQLTTVNFLLVPPVTSNTFAVPSTQLDVLIKPTNAPAVYYTPDVYLQSRTISFVMVVCSAAALLLLLIGHMFRGLLAVELIGVLQIGFFAVSLVGEMPPPITASADLGLLANGYNYRPKSSIGMKPQLQTMGLSLFFLENLNVMLAV